MHSVDSKNYLCGEVRNTQSTELPGPPAILECHLLANNSDLAFCSLSQGDNAKHYRGTRKKEKKRKKKTCLYILEICQLLSSKGCKRLEEKVKFRELCCV